MTPLDRMERPTNRDAPAGGGTPRRTARAACLLALLTFSAAPLAAGPPAAAPPAEADLSDPAPLAARSLLLDAVSRANRIVAVGDRGHVLVSDDGGRMWTQIRVPTRSMLTAVAMPDSVNVWAVGHDQMILHSADGGRTWERQHNAPEEDIPLLDVWFENASHGLAVGAYGLLLETRDGGRTWTRRLFDEEERHGNALVHAPDGTLFIPAEYGNVFRSQDGGATWEAVQTPYQGSFFGGLALPDGSLLAFGLRGNVYRSADGRAAWEKVPTGTTASLLGGSLLPDGTVVIVGLSGAVLVSRDAGRSFTPVHRPDRQALSAVVPAGAPGQVVLLGEGGATRETRLFNDTSPPPRGGSEER